MARIRIGKDKSNTFELHYEDHGAGRPVVLIHGWPLSGRSWDKQVPALLQAGYRVITYDRRGFGESSQPVAGYDYDTFTSDLHALITRLNLRDFALVGFSMGGGEVARYLGTHGSENVTAAVFMSAVVPFMLKTPDNPAGVDGKVFEGIKQAIAVDRHAFLTKFFTDFYNVDTLGGRRISEQEIRASWEIAARASPIATLECVGTWGTDFRRDLAKIETPSLVIHGDADRICPFEATGKRTHESLKTSRLAIIKDGPHGVNWTHAEEVNQALLNFLHVAMAGNVEKVEFAPQAKAA